MNVIIYWRRFKVKPLTGTGINHIVWQFRVSNHHFSCSCQSVHKRRRPKRIFLGLAVHRPNYKYGFDIDGEFKVENKEVWKKLK